MGLDKHLHSAKSRIGRHILKASALNKADRGDAR
jgi:hypothetical protein